MKKVLCALLCAVMLFTLVPLQASAVTVMDTVTIENAVVPREGQIPGYYYSFDSSLISPCYDIEDANTISGIYWQIKTPKGWNEISPHDTFLANHSYRLNIYIHPADGMRFNSKENMTVTVNGVPSSGFNVYGDSTEGYNGQSMWLSLIFNVVHEHMWYDNVLQPATEENQGVMTQKCACGEESDLMYIPRYGYCEIDDYHATRGYSYTGKNNMPEVYCYDEDENLLTEGVDYVLTYPKSDKSVGTYEVLVQLIGKYAGEDSVRYNVHLGKPTTLTAKVSTDTVALKWDKVIGAQYYRIYGLNLSTGKFKKICDTKNNYYNRTGRSPGTQYAYAVRAVYKNKAGTVFMSPFDAEYDTVYVTTLCVAPKVKATVSGKTVTLKWGKCAKAAYYRVYEYNAKTKKYTLLISSTGKTSVSLKKQSKGTHYYLVRSYNNINLGSKYSTKNLAKAVVR